MKKILLLILAALLLIAGFNGCPVTPTTTKKGLDFSLVVGLDKLSSGKTISVGETFYIHIEVTNYDKVPRVGKVCIRDDQDDIYGGITGEECTTFSVEAADVVEEEKKGFFGGKTEKVQPKIGDIYFPSSGDYSYGGLPITQKAKLFVTLRYAQDSIVGSSVAIPEPSSATLELEQEPAPVTVTARKEVTRREDAYKVSLSIQLAKEQQAKIFPPNFREEDENYLSFKAEMLPKILECKPEGTYSEEKLRQGLIQLKTKKYIKCSALIYEEEQTSLPLIITLKYGVELAREFPFTIAVEE